MILSKTMRIGAVSLENNLIMAPLAGISNLPFRLIAKSGGCGLVCSEMISAKGIWYHCEKTLGMLASEPEEKPLSVQIFGAEPEIMAHAAGVVAQSGADMVDINFGCSVKKVVKTGSGVALMREPRKAERIITAVRKAIDIPLTIKIRTGWEHSGNQAMEISEIAQGCGVDAITIHPRTASQGFRGKANWSLIKILKDQLNIPVIGNGDIRHPQDAVTMLQQTGCDGIMVGRAAIGNPWIFSHILDAFHEAHPRPVPIEERFAVMERYLKLSVKYLGEKRACLMMRGRLGWFSKGLPIARQLRKAISHITSMQQALDILAEYKQSISFLYGEQDAPLYESSRADFCPESQR